MEDVLRHSIQQNLPHILFVLLLISRLGDIISTRLASPKLLLEANPIARWLGWPFIYATVLISFMPYFDIPSAVTILPPFLMVSASNLQKAYVSRLYGEEHYSQQFHAALAKNGLGGMLLYTLAAGVFVALLGIALMIIAEAEGAGLSYDFGMGILLYALVIGGYGSLFYLKKAREMKRSSILGA